jgi:hypothetical protein
MIKLTFYKRCVFLLLGIIVFIASGFAIAEKYRTVRNESFTTGEVLEYRIHYGFINAGDAVIEVNPKLHRLNNRPCYKIDVRGRTTGTFDMFLRIRNNYGSYIDTAAFIPHKSIRNVEEGRYRKFEVTTFDYNHDQAIVKDEARNEEKKLPVPKNVQDMIGGYYFLRLLDYDHMNVGDTIRVNAVFENELYDFKIRYMGKEKLKTKFGSIPAITLVPVMPDNKMFDGENSISVWLSDDKNRIPLKIKANMFVGAVELDLKGYRGLKNRLNFTN